ncbi:hypothetical protein COCON_G00179240 [Conger conger]|uniref:Uncharacterized protein n=1 Tax=Conger conger TaxID=82655 RepID=A0A9Q1HSE3_CONCO|nr:hypothetical protein COCON_G00179240 [Conger conger]
MRTALQQRDSNPFWLCFHPKGFTTGQTTDITLGCFCLPACLPELNKDNHAGNVAANQLWPYILPANRSHSGSGFYQTALISEPEVPSPLCSVRGLRLSSMLFKH